MRHWTALPPAAPLLLALLVAGYATPGVGADVATTGMPNTEAALRDSMRVVDAEMGKLGVMSPSSQIAGPVVPAELRKVVAFSYAGTLEDSVRQLAGNVG